MLKNSLKLLIIGGILIPSVTKSNLLQENNHLYAVILAGGKGERLWPLSREHKPKQFLEFLDNKTLLELTFNRAISIIPPEHVWVITNQSHAKQVRTLLGDTLGGIISEPTARDTAPAHIAGLPNTHPT